MKRTNCTVKFDSNSYICKGEVGLGGELRAGKNTDLRIAEAKKLGFSRIVLPATSTSLFTKGTHASVSTTGEIQLIQCSTLAEVVQQVLSY